MSVHLFQLNKWGKLAKDVKGKCFLHFCNQNQYLKKMMANHQIANNRFLNTISIYLISFCKNLEVNKYGENIGIFVWSKTWDSLPLNGRASAEKCKYCSTTLVMRKLLPSIFVVWNFMICPEQSAFVNTRNKIYFTSHRYIFHAQPKSKCCWDIYPLTILWYVIMVLATLLLTYLYIQVIDMFQADFQFASSLVRKWTQTNNF